MPFHCIQLNRSRMIDGIVINLSRFEWEWSTGLIGLLSWFRMCLRIWAISIMNELRCMYTNSTIAIERSGRECEVWRNGNLRNGNANARNESLIQFTFSSAFLLVFCLLIFLPSSEKEVYGFVRFILRKQCACELYATVFFSCVKNKKHNSSRRVFWLLGNPFVLSPKRHAFAAENDRLIKYLTNARSSSAILGTFWRGRNSNDRKTFHFVRTRT